MSTLIDNISREELLDEEAIQILNKAYGMNQPVTFWFSYDRSAVAKNMIDYIRRDRNKEPDFAEGENEPDSVCTPPTRAGC